MELARALTFARTTSKGVLTTLRRDGRPQLSNVVYSVGSDHRFRVSVTADRAKTKNLARDPRASLYLLGDDFWAYAVIDGLAELSPTASEPGDATCDELVDLYRSLQGEHPDWDDYRTAMVRDRRLVLRITPGSAYGMLRN